MYDFFDKHGKKTLAVLGSILILAFLMPGTMGRTGGISRQYGKLDGQPIDDADYAATLAAYQAVSHLEERPPQQGPDQMPGQRVPLPAGYFGSLAQKFNQNPLMWYLLVREARDAGVQPSEQQIDEMISSPTIYLNDPSLAQPTALKTIHDYNASRLDEFKPGMRDLLAVRDFFIRHRNSIKLTRPMIDDAIARQNQQIRARLASFSASDYASQLSPPTDEELRAQLDAYAADAPGSITTTNPFGFGYRIPDKLRLQWIEIPQDEVAKTIEASRPAEIWDEDAIIYYQKHPEEFQTRPATPATTAPATAPTLRPYSEAKADVLRKLRQPLIDEQQRKIVNRIVQQMTLDAQRAREKAPTTQEIGEWTNAAGVAIGSVNYLQNIADDIQKQFSVKVAVSNPTSLLTLTDVSATRGIGDATVPDDSGSPYGPPSAATYLFASCKPLVADANQIGTYDLFQPSKVLQGTNSMFVARATAAEPSHPPRALDEVRSQVEKDLKAKKSFASAALAAQKYLDAANTLGAITKVPGPAVVTTDWIGSDAFELAGAKEIANGYQLIQPLFDQLRGLTSPSQLPRRTIIKRQALGSVVVAEVYDIRTKLSTENSDQQRFMALQDVLQSAFSQKLNNEMIADWFSMDGVSRRMGYVPESSPNAPGSKPAGPSNPFVPG